MASWPPVARPETAESRGRRFFADFREGARALYNIERVRWLLILSLVGNVGFVIMTPLLPALVRTHLRSGPALFGFLETAAGVGLLLSGLASPWVVKRVGFGRLFVAGRAVPAGLLIVVGWIAAPWLSLALIGLYWFIRRLAGPPLVALLQSEVPEAVRGRVYTVFGSTEALLAPVAMLAGGWLATRIGAAPTLMVGGAWTLVSTLAMATLPTLRRAIGVGSAAPP
jgi:hypothetical protein